MDLKKDWSEPASAKYTAEEKSITPRINLFSFSMSVDRMDTSNGPSTPGMQVFFFRTPYFGCGAHWQIKHHISSFFYERKSTGRANNRAQSTFNETQRTDSEFPSIDRQRLILILFAYNRLWPISCKLNAVTLSTIIEARADRQSAVTCVACVNMKKQLNIFAEANNLGSGIVRNEVN